MQKYTLTSIIAIFLFPFCIHAQLGIQFNTDNWTTHLASATAADKPIFVDAYTTWCAPCKKMDIEVFIKEDVGRFFNDNFVNVKLDMEKGEGLEFAKQYNVSVFPTLLFLSPNGKVLHRVAGYKTVAELIELGQTALDPARRLASMETMFDKGNRDPKFLYNYTIARYNAHDGSHEIPAEAYLNTQGDWAKQDNMRFIFSYVFDTESNLFKYFLENKQAFIDTFGERAVSGKLQQIVYNKVNGTKEKSSLEQIDEMYQKVYPEKAAFMSSRFRMTYYRQAGDREKYAAAAIQHFKDYPKANPAELNETAWTFYQVIDDEAMLNQAVKWSKKSIKMDKAYYNHDTLAALYYKLGKKKKAKKTLTKAIKLAEKYNEDFSKSMELMEMIEEME